MFIAKPRMFNNIGRKEFETALEAVQYLNEMLKSREGDEDRFEYKFSALSTHPRKLKKTIQEYMDIGKLIEA
jgi:hypothetical protein